MKKRKILILNLLIILIILAIFMPISQATVDNTIYETESNISIYVPENKQPTRIGGQQIIGKEFFIKNVCTGQYLDVSGGVAANGTNVQQYKYNGTDSQKWYIHYNEDGTFSIFTKLASSNGYSYALDISNGSSANYANVQIYGYNATDSQKFSIYVADNERLIFYTKVSNNTKAIVLNGPTFEQGGNIDQYTYQGHVNEQWILEPVEIDASLGVDYAKANYNSYLYTYPNVSNMTSKILGLITIQNGGDCANFVSQCLLASGIHYQNDWYVYRKNSNYSTPTTTEQLNNSWEIADPSPWISAKAFKEYWEQHVTTYTYSASEILANPELAINLGLHKGDVIQLASRTILGGSINGWHTMYITDYTTYSGHSTYDLTYHSTNTEHKSLLEICEGNSDSYVVFFKFI